MNVTLELIELQAYVLSKGESIISQDREYKSTPEVLDILHKIWESISDPKERIFLEKLVAGTNYKI